MSVTTSGHSASGHSVTQIIEALKQGAEGEPQEQIVARFLHRLETLAGTRMRSGGYEDGEDVAISAIRSFFRQIPGDGLAYVTDRDSLWGLLAAITLNKALSSQRRQFAQKRDMRRQVSLQSMEQGAPAYEFLDSMVAEATRLLESLKDPICRAIAQLRMEGYANKEIAKKIGRSEKTVERKLRYIRKVLRAELTQDA